MSNHRITLDQWRAFVTVVDAGGYAQAAELLHKSQSTISYAVQKLESLLDLQLLEVRGRKAELTAAGEVLLLRARQVLEAAASLERQAASLSRGIEPVIHLALDAVLPRALTLSALARVAERYPQTRVELNESILSGAQEALLSGQADLIVTGRVPRGFASRPLGRVAFVCMTSPEHPLQRQPAPPDLKDLTAHRQVVVRDSGPQRRFNAPWLEAGQRWTVSTLDTSLQALRMGLGFAWFPLSIAQPEIDQGRLQPVPLSEGSTRYVDLHLVLRDPASAGPATRMFAEALVATLAEAGAAHGISPA